MSLAGTDIQKLEALAKKTYKEQAIWFLNAFWAERQGDAERIWKYVEKFASLDLQRGAAGFELDELNGHRFLESFNETMTVREMRDTLRSKEAIGDKVKTFPLVHYLTIRYNIDWHVLVNAPQGNQDDVIEAQRRLAVAQAALKESEAKAEAAKAAANEAKARAAAAKAAEAEAKAREAAAKAAEEDAKASEAAAKARAAEAATAEAEAKAREADARAREDEAKAREAEARAAQDELEAALAELKKEEDAYNNKKADLERKSEEGGVVSRNKAKAELAQHLAEDPLPLRRAKINQEAAVRKAEKATQIAADARGVASAAAAQAAEAARQASAARAAAEEAARQASAARAAAEEAARQASAARAAAEEAARQAEAAARAAEEAARQAEAAVEEARQRFQEAEEFLESVKNTIGYGQSWWIDREIHEAKAYLPASKGGYAKQK